VSYAVCILVAVGLFVPRPSDGLEHLNSEVGATTSATLRAGPRVCFVSPDCSECMRCQLLQLMILASVCRAVSFSFAAVQTRLKESKSCMGWRLLRA